MRHMAPTMPRQDSRARAERAFALRSIGRTWREIAAELGFASHGAAQLAVARHLDRTAPESPHVARRSAVESLRITTAVLFDRFAEAVKRDDDAAVALLNRELVRNRDQQAKLDGLYQPQRTEVDVNVRQSPAALIADTRAKLLALAGQTEGTATALPTIDAEVIEQ